MNDLQSLTDQQLGSIHLASSRVDLMLSQFNQHMRSAKDGSFIFEPGGIYLYLFLSLLYPVLEFLTTRNLRPAKITQDIESIYGDLCEFRNCTFHIQDQVVSPRQQKLMKNHYSIRTAAKIHKEIYFLLSIERDRRSSLRFPSHP